MTIAWTPVLVTSVLGNPADGAFRFQLAGSLAAAVALLILGGWLALHGEFPWSKRYWLEKKEMEALWAAREEAARVAQEAQRKTLQRLSRLCVEPVIHESGRVYWRGTAEKLREWVLVGALAGPERDEAERLIFDCELLNDHPFVAPLQVRAPGPRATVDALREIVVRPG